MDLISSFPDVILQHILFFVPTQLAITTSVLSRRWRRVWSDTPSLSFDDSYRPLAHAARINETLDRYTAPKMTKFHLKTRMYHTVASVADMDRWMEFVMSCNVDNLSIPLRRFELPHSCMIPSCSVSWTSLKKLSVSNCSLSDETVAKILCGCPILESLKLDHCPQLRVLDLSKSLGVRTLEIACSRFVSGSMQIVAPHVHSLRLWHNYQLPCPLVDVSSLTEAKVDVSCHSVREIINGYDLFQFLREMLEKLQNAEKLTFGCTIIPLLSVAEVRGITFPMLKIKALILETEIFQCVIPIIERLLQNSPNLKTVTVHANTQLYGDYPRFKFEELVQTLPHNNTVSIDHCALNQAEWHTHHMSGES
ncbi:PREDICTED: putative F-box/LRR-repeat protein At3g18150 [Camelina sativa]|uniref:F-box/LRR-repeat protein At3g18150 n=1 Tax=Camelina sativa TaxID=90675 RepID=A0ABM1R9E7_CAMSA|nr:PREDICTED: putative F-box/LRR-repeat protein At3g18150 [Camelina sativa]